MKKLGLSLATFGMFIFCVATYFALKDELFGENAFCVLLASASFYIGGLVVYFRKLFIR